MPERPLCTRKQSFRLDIRRPLRLVADLRYRYGQTYRLRRLLDRDSWDLRGLLQQPEVRSVPRALLLLA